jgi:hypothetical protein
VRKALERLNVQQVQSAYETALSRSVKARASGDKHMADVFSKVADETAQELEDRVLTIAAGEVVRESQAANRQATELLHQMMDR